MTAKLEATGWSLEHLRLAARLKCSRGSLHRKLYGYRKPGTKRTRVFQPMSVDEYRRLAAALDVLTPDLAAQLDAAERLGSLRADRTRSAASR